MYCCKDTLYQLNFDMLGDSCRERVKYTYHYMQVHMQRLISEQSITFGIQENTTLGKAVNLGSCSFFFEIRKIFKLCV